MWHREHKREQCSGELRGDTQRRATARRGDVQAVSTLRPLASARALCDVHAARMWYASAMRAARRARGEHASCMRCTRDVHAMCMRRASELCLQSTCGQPAACVHCACVALALCLRCPYGCERRAYGVSPTVRVPGVSSVRLAPVACVRRACATHASCMPRACNVHTACKQHACGVYATCVRRAHKYRVACIGMHAACLRRARGARSGVPRPRGQVEPTY